MKNDGCARTGFSCASHAARRGGEAACVRQQRLSSHFDNGKSGSVEPLFQQELWRSRPYFPSYGRLALFAVGDIAEGIDRHAVPADFKMQMSAVAAAGVACQADFLAAGDRYHYILFEGL